MQRLRLNSQTYSAPGIIYTEHDLISDVCTHFNITTDCIKSKSRKSNVVEARMITMSIMKDMFRDRTLKWIGGTMGGFSHSTVICAIKTITDYCSIYPDFKVKFDNINKTIRYKVIKKSTS